MKHLDGAAPFPDSDDKDTLYVKLSWDSKTFKVVDAALVESHPAPASSPPNCPKPSLPPSPPCSPPAAAPASQRALPTPDPAIMYKAASGEVRYSRATMSAGKAGPMEAESLHSATKLSASKCLSAKRRSASARKPGVRKKLELSSECFKTRREIYPSVEKVYFLIPDGITTLQKYRYQKGCVLIIVLFLMCLFPLPFRSRGDDPSEHPQSAAGPGSGAGGDVGRKAVVLPSSCPAPQPQPHPPQEGSQSVRSSTRRLPEVHRSHPQQTV